MCVGIPTQSEAIPESIKNLLLVMSTQGVLEVSVVKETADQVSKKSLSVFISVCTLCVVCV